MIMLFINIRTELRNDSRTNDAIVRGNTKCRVAHSKYVFTMDITILIANNIILMQMIYSSVRPAARTADTATDKFPVLIASIFIANKHYHYHNKSAHISYIEYSAISFTLLPLCSSLFLRFSLLPFSFSFNAFDAFDAFGNRYASAVTPWCRAVGCPIWSSGRPFRNSSRTCTISMRTLANTFNSRYRNDKSRRLSATHETSQRTERRRVGDVGCLAACLYSKCTSMFCATRSVH